MLYKSIPFHFSANSFLYYLSLTAQGIAYSFPLVRLFFTPIVPLKYRIFL